MSGDPFMMDYKQSSYGFSVIKTLEEASYASQARAINIRRHLPLTVVKQVIYDSQFQYIRKERISMYFHSEFHDKGFHRAIMYITRSACEALHGPRHVSSNDFEIEISNVAHQTPRLLLGPLLERVVKEHLRFFFSKALRMYVACGFYTDKQGEYSSSDKEPTPTTGMCFNEVKSLLANTKRTSFMSLPEYWKVYRECEKLKDVVTLRSLRSSSYVELLDTVIHDSADIVNGHQKPSKVDILEARPALIQPSDINMKTGLPDRLVSPDTYSNNDLWRYWSPDQPENVATRGHIFVMDQTCIDLKIGRLEKTEQLTFRPIYKDIPEIKFELSPTKTGKWVNLTVYPRLFSVRTESSRSRRLSNLAHGIPQSLLNLTRKPQHRKD